MGKEKKEKKAKKEKQLDIKAAKTGKGEKPKKSEKVLKKETKSPKLQKEIKAEKPAAVKPEKVKEPVILAEQTDDSFDAMDFVTTMVGGKWKMKVIYALRDKNSRRYSEIKSNVPGITDMMLSSSLKELVEDGLVERKQFSEVPLRVEYQISEFGYQLTPALNEMVKWAIANR